MTKSLIFVVVTIAAIAGIGTFIISRPKVQTSYSCINNLPQFPEESIEKMKKQDEQVSALVPLGTTFSNAVAVLGDNFKLITNRNRPAYAVFKCTLPGTTNVSYVSFQLENNIVVRTVYMHLLPAGDPFYN